MPQAQSRIIIKKPQIREVPLGETKDEKTFGQAFKDSYKIEICPHNNDRSYLNSLNHELLHVILPDASETKIKQVSTILTKAIWEAGYRRK